MKTILGLLLLCSSLMSSASGQEKKDTLRVLFVGNSYIYYNNLAQLTMVLTDSTDTKLICTKSTLGGGTLGDHWHSRKGLQTRHLLETKTYDIVILQDNSMYPIEHADSTRHYGKLLCDVAKSKGAKVYLYNTWSRKMTPETQPQINQTYQQLAAICDAAIVPVGDAWAAMISTVKDVELYHPDQSHPSYLGTFLASLCFIKTITGQLPHGYPDPINYTDKDGEFFRIMRVTDKEIKQCTDAVHAVIPHTLHH